MKCPLVWWWLSLLACRCLAYKMDSYRNVAAQSDSLQAELATLREAVREEIKQTLTSEVAAQLRPQQVRPAFSEPAPQNSQRLTQLLKTVSANLSSAEGHLASRCSKKVTAHVARKHPFVLSQSNLSNHATSCDDDKLPIFDYKPTAISTTCCPTSRLDCAGCAEFGSRKCKRCAPGFVEREGSCVACTDSAEWTDQQSNTCAQSSTCNDIKVKGQSSKQACCRCGGGHISPTVFSYPDKAFAVGEAVTLAPIPRTAARYTLNFGCEFAAYNLTMDGSTGLISYSKGMQMPKQPFQVQCEVTAHQAPGVAFTAVASVTPSWITYESRVLGFRDSESYSLKTSGDFQNLKISCAPVAPWLKFDSATAKLSLDKSQQPRGGVVSEGEAFTGQDGSVCVVTGSAGEKHGKISFVAVRPRPWDSLTYTADKVSVSIGEELPLLRPQPRGGSLKPKAFFLGCQSSIDWVDVAFDRTLGVLLVAGVPLIQVSESGELAIGAPEAMATIFDSMKMAKEFQSAGGAFRQSLTVSCAVWGAFADPEMPQVRANVDVDIKDNVCWVPQKIAAKQFKGPGTTEAECRRKCRVGTSCSHFSWKNGACFRYAWRATGTKYETLAKVACHAETCLSVQDADWRNSGVYCPLGSAEHGRVYRKKANTTQDAFYLEPYDLAHHRSSEVSGSCAAGDWLIRAPAASDYADVKAGHYELKGNVLKCIPRKSKSVQFQVRDCPKPAQLHTPDQVIPTLVADDPGTRAPQDFWLHPCDCAPEQWGKAAPVNEEAWEAIPSGSSNEYIAAPYAIVSGQFVCPSRQLLGQHWETESEVMERSDCEARCRQDSKCNYFWHGTQHSASVCRTFRACDVLVREFGLDGTLSAMPRQKTCQVADANLCWQTTMRRSFLARPPSANSKSSAKAEIAPMPKKPADPPSNKMVSWFKSEDAGSIWRSSVGKHVGKSVKNAPVRGSAAGFGADRPVTFLEGDKADAFDFGWVLPKTFTLCSVTRYTGLSNQKRILQGKNNNFLHGHHEGHVGVAHYGKWVTSKDRRKFDLNWLVLCGTNKAKRVYDGSAGIATKNCNKDMKDKLLINAGKHSGEASNFAVMEVMTWSRALSSKEMKQVAKYLQWKLQAGTFQESEHMGTPKEFSLYEKKKNLQASSTYSYDKKMVNGYTLKLKGWTHMRDYAKGYLRNTEGTASAVVSGLAKQAAYQYELYSVSTKIKYVCSKNTVSVNGDTQATMRQSNSNLPSASGIVTSSSAGEIKFSLGRYSGRRRTCPHLQLRSVSVAKLLPAGGALPAKPSDPPRKGMVSWFRSEDAGSVWKSSVGKYVGVATKNSPMRSSAAGFGADRPVTFLQGGENDDFTFGKVLKKTWTLCSVSRYTGGKMGRIFQGKKYNILHGHHSGSVGVAHYDEWVTDKSRDKKDLSWLVMCGSNKAKRVYSGLSNVATKNRNKNLEDHLMVNAGKHGGENSDFAIMEVITWNRALSSNEMKTAVRYLQWKLQAGTFRDSEHMSTDWEARLEKGDAKLKTDKTYTKNLANGYKLELTGWTHTRLYARGYLRNTKGSATGVVSKLKPNAQYRFEVQSFASSHRRRGGDYSCNANQISVNHGAYATMRQDKTRSPSASGVITSSPRGKIQFEFVRQCHHVQLMSISVARMYGSAASMLDIGRDSMSLGSESDAEASYNSRGFQHLHLHEQCDTQLLLGGMGVQQCTRPGFRGLRSHAWKHKRALPETFQHGQSLSVSCWAERFAGLQQAKASAGEAMQCVDGSWHGAASSFHCEACLQVAAKGYMALDARDKQELYFFNRMQMGIYSELGLVDLGASTYCLQQAEGSGAVTLESKDSCSVSFMAEITPAAESHDRLFQYLPDGTETSKPNCLQLHPKKVFSVKKCKETEVAQQIAPSELPIKMWDLHVLTDARTTDIHGAYASECGAHGALNNLDFKQLFAGNAQRVRTSCKFAPLLSFGQPMDSGISRDKNSDKWNDWWHMLAEHPIECQTGQALTGMKLDVAKKSYLYECSYIGGLGSCFEYFSGQVEVPSFSNSPNSWKPALSKLVVSCGENSVISTLHFEFSEGGRWARVRYFCCKAGGSPTVVEPLGYLEPGGKDGKYCPTSRDSSGRPVYENADGTSLSFDSHAGKWCIGTECSDVNGAATPLHLSGKSFEVVDISDFDGAFESMGIPKLDASGKQSAKSLLASLKKPKKPKLPKMPELESFKAEMPTYSSECLNYKDLWTKITETFKNSEGEQVSEESPIEADPSTADKEMQEYHPCEIARHVGGTFGKLGKGDGSNTPENMLYDDWEWCGEGDRERDLLVAQRGLRGARSEHAANIAKSVANWACEFAPNVEIAPFGAGIEIGNSDICGDAVDLTDAVRRFTVSGLGDTMSEENFNMQLAQEGYDACSVTQVGFPRIFCDLHCTRDAVIRGDRSIIRNLETATKKTNANMKSLAQWSVDTTKLLNDWVASKMDYTDAVNSIYFKEILSKLGGETDSSLLERSADAMLLELKSLAETAGARYGSDASRATTQDALLQFIQGPDLSASAANASEATAFLERLEDLHAILHRAADGNKKRSDIILRQLAGDIGRLQGQLQGQLRIMGMYRSESRAETAAVQKQVSSQISTFERHTMLVSLDQVWWQLRNKLDQYSDVAQDELAAFHSAFADFQNFEACSVSFSDLILSYTAAMSTLQESHRQLRATWRETSNLFGELVAIAVDGDAFTTFRRLEGCQSSLASQTVRQAQAAVKGLYFLVFRMRAAGLGKPDQTTILEAIQRLKESYGRAMQGCEGTPFTAV